MKASLDTITIAIRKSWDEEWPDGFERQALIEAVEREFDVVEVNGPYASGTWNFVMRERDHAHAAARLNELISEHVEG